MIIEAGTCYFTIDYVSGFKTVLPKEFTGGLNREGDGTIVIRYGGRRIPVFVREWKLGCGWRTFTTREKFPSGTTFFVAHNGGHTIALLKFGGGVGSNSTWHSNVDAFDIESQLLLPDVVPEDVVTQTIRTAYFPQYMSLFLARPSGFCTFEQSFSMRAPYNLAQHLLSENRPVVAIRSGDRLFENIEVTLGYFQGPQWAALVRACDFEVGFKIFLFLTRADQLEMIVIGKGNMEAVYAWARVYHKIM